MSSLAEQIEQLQEVMLPQIPEEVLAEMSDAMDLLKQYRLVEQAIKDGDVAPDFDLPEFEGGRVCLSSQLAEGPVVVSFYRGAWCPYCNLEMQALQKVLPQIEQAGGKLIAIAPELPEQTGLIRKKGNLTFPLLNDRDNVVAKAYGVVFKLPESLRPVYESLGIDLVASQGNDQYELPVPATYIIKQDGNVAHAFVNVDYTMRMEPDDIVEILKTL